MLKRNLLYLTLITSCSLFVIILLVNFLFFKKRNSIIIQGKSGPYIEIGAQLNGLILLAEGKILVSSRKQGLYIFHPKENWKKLDTFSNIGEISSITKIDKTVFISTKEGNLIKVKESDINGVNTTKFTIINISRSFIKILKCNNRIIGLSNEGLFNIDNEKTTKYEDNGIIPQTADCNDDTVFVGTRTTGIEICNINNRVCVRSNPVFPYPDVRGIAWDKNEKALYAGQYGTPFGLNVLKLTGNKWIPIGSYIGDVVAFYKDDKQRFKRVIIEKGILFDYMDSTFKPRNINVRLTPFYSEISDKTFYAISFGNLIYSDNGEIKNYGAPILLDKVDDSEKYGNTYIWDIDIADKNAVFAATSQMGVWWSSNGGITWSPINNGLDDNKIHFVKFNKKNNMLFAGTHSTDIYICKLPCKKWEPVNDKEIFNSDFQEAIELDPDRYVLATKKGAIIFNLKDKKVEKQISLQCNDKTTDRVTQFWLANYTNKNIFLGIYPIPVDCPVGLWRLDESSKLIKVYDINEPISGISFYKDTYYVSSLNALYKCANSNCTLINKLMINRMTLAGNILWLATSKGVGFLDLQENDHDIKWVLDIPAQIVKVLNEKEGLLLIGTLASGVIRVKVKI